MNTPMKDTSMRSAGIENKDTAFDRDMRDCMPPPSRRFRRRRWPACAPRAMPHRPPPDAGMAGVAAGG